MTKVLITGGTGFVGSHLSELLSREPERFELHVTHVSPVPESMRTLFPAAHFHQLDLTNKAQVQVLLTEVKPNQIYQLASIPTTGSSFEAADTTMRDNTSIIVNILDASRTLSPKPRLLVVTSAEVYGLSLDKHELPIDEYHPFRPVNPYGVSKVAQDLLAECYGRAYELEIVRARPFNHIGERQQAGFAVADFAKQIVAIEKGQQDVLRVGDLSTQRDFTDVKDMVRAYALLMEQGIPGEAYNIGTGNAVTMQWVVDKLCAMSDSTIKVEQEATRMRPTDVPVMVADPRKIKVLGWRQEIPLQETLMRVLGYWRAL